MLFDDAYSIWTEGIATQDEAAKMLRVSGRTMLRGGSAMRMAVWMP